MPNAANNDAPSYTDSLAEVWPVLESSGWLADVESGRRARLLPVARVQWYGTGDYLYHTGDEADGVYGLVRGGLDICIPRDDGEECFIHRAETGFWIGDLALIASDRRLVGVRAACDSVVVHLPQDGLNRILQHQPDLFADFYRLTYRNMSLAIRLLGNLAVPGAEKRIALRLLMLADQLQQDSDWIPVSQASLAELVALSPQTVRRTLRVLQDRRLIEAGYRRIRLVDRAALIRLSHSTDSHP